MASDLTSQLLGAAVATIREHAERLTELDQAIGDGDHGINMMRGFAAVEEAADTWRDLDLPEVLQKVGMALVMKVGGAAGPLYGSLIMAMGKAADDEPASVADVAPMLAEGVAAVKKRGKSDRGEKTMLDVLVPVSDALSKAASETLPPTEVLARVRAAAEQGLESTRDMRATKGRASFLGERSQGHLDPGAMSSCVLAKAVCDIIEDSL